MNARTQNIGFTLIELMITIAIAAVLLAIAGPGLRQIIVNNRIATEAAELQAALNLARAESAKRNEPVTLCKSANTTSCTTAGNWEQGWIVFNDVDRDGVVDAGDGDGVIQSYEGMPDGFTLREGGDFSNWISYLPQGQAVGSGSSTISDAFRICSPEQVDDDARQISINATGRPYLKEGLDGGLDCP